MGLKSYYEKIAKEQFIEKNAKGLSLKLLGELPVKPPRRTLAGFFKELPKKFPRKFPRKPPKKPHVEESSLMSKIPWGGVGVGFLAGQLVRPGGKGVDAAKREKEEQENIEHFYGY